MTSKKLIDNWQNSFNYIYEQLNQQLQKQESFSLELKGEDSHFVRFNQAKIRQTGLVWDAQVELKLISHQRTMKVNFPLTGDKKNDLISAETYFNELREDIKSLAVDPFQVLPEMGESSYEVYDGELLAPDHAVEYILPAVEDLDFTGFYASGYILRANYNSTGRKNWFATPSFSLDYSLINPQEKSIKGVISAPLWDQAHYETQISTHRQLLSLLSLPQKEIKPGRYRTYFCPCAVADLVSMFSWGAVSESSLRQGGSALGKMRHQGWQLSPLFNLSEDFRGGNVPRFNSFGEISSAYIPLIVEGKLVNTLINQRTAKEYNLISNDACVGEFLRSPVVSSGNLSSEKILSELNTGLYISNLHYLNWSDRTTGKVTGMTRYGCFWIENGQIVATIKNLRFDDSLYNYFGNNLLELTDFVEFIPNLSSYNHRSFGGCTVPGALVADFNFTL